MIDFNALEKVVKANQTEAQKPKALNVGSDGKWVDVTANELLDFFFERSGILMDTGLSMSESDAIARDESCKRYRVSVFKIGRESH